jgi:hypothetical protein
MTCFVCLEPVKVNFDIWICGTIPGRLPTLLTWDINGTLPQQCAVNPVNIYVYMIIRGLTCCISLEPVRVNFYIRIFVPIPGRLPTLLNWNVNGILPHIIVVNTINIYGSMIIRGLTCFVSLEPVRVNFDIWICGPIPGRLATMPNWDVNGILPQKCVVNPNNIYIYISMIIRGLTCFISLEPVRVNFDIWICGPIPERLATLLNWDVYGTLPQKCVVNTFNIYLSMIIRGLTCFVCLEPVKVNFDIWICGPIPGRLVTLLNWDVN